MRAMVCHTFPRYTFEDIDDMILDDWAELAAGAIWIQEETAKRTAAMFGGGGKRKRG